MKVIIASDLQIPYHDKRATTLLMKVMKWFKAEQVILPGDIEDQAEYSRWTDGGTQEFMSSIDAPPDGDTMMRKVFDNSRATKEFYTDVRNIHKDSRIITALGNHDIRIFNYFDKKAPELSSQITVNSLWDFENLGIEHIMYEDRPLHLWGGVHVHHGVSISKHAGESVRNDVDNFGVSLIRGHSHRQAVWYRSYPLRNETLIGIETGHLMDINSSGASYDNIHNWQMGFVVAHVESSGLTKDGLYPHFNLVKINENYECVVDGKLFRG